MVDKSKRISLLNRRHKLRKLHVSSIHLQKSIQKPRKQTPRLSQQQQESETIENLQVKPAPPAVIIPELGNVHRTLTSQFDILSSIAPIYSGGKISIQPIGDTLNIFSSYNFNVVRTQYSKHQTKDKVTLTHREEDIANFAVTNDGTRIVTFTKNYLVRCCLLVDPLKTQWTQKIEPLFPIDMAVSPEDVFVALGCTNGAIRILNVQKGTTSHEYRYHKGSVLKVAWHPMHRKLQLASAGDDQKIIIFDVVANSCLCQIAAHEARITSLSFIRHGQYLVSTAADQYAKLWDLAQYQQVQSVRFPIDLESGAVVTLNKSEYILMGSLDGNLHVASPDSLKEYQTFSLFEGQEILKIITLKDQDSFFAITNELHIYEVSVKLHQGRFQFTLEQCVLGYNDEILDVRFEQRLAPLAGGYRIENESVLIATNSPFLKLVSISTMQVKAWKAHDDIVMCIHFVDGIILSGAKDKLIKMWKLDEARNPLLMATYKGHTDSIVGVILAPKDKSLVASVSSDMSLKLWEGVQKVEQSGTNEILQSKRSVQAHEKDINIVKFSPNQKMIATSSQDRKIKIWNPDNLMMTMQLEGHKRGVWDVQFSPVEKLLASASGDQTIKIWDLVTGQIVHNLEGHACSVLKVNWLCFGQILLSSDTNGLLKLWNMKKQTCINTFEKHDGKVWALDVSPYTKEGKVYLATGGNDSMFHIWKDATEELNEQEQQKHHEKQLKLQQFSNLMKEQRFREAAILAFDANFTSHFIKAVQSLYELINIDNEQRSEIQDLAKTLILEQTLKFMDTLNQLNLSVKTYHLAQALYNSALNACKVQEIIKRTGSKEDQSKLVQKCKYFLQITQKHHSRIQSLKQQSHIIDYLLERKTITI